MMLLTIFVILLLLWLVGVIGNFTFGGLIHLLLVVALVVLVLNLADRGGRRVYFNRNIGLLLAGIWFILTGLPSLISFSIPGQGLVLALLATIAGVLLVLGR
jgi:hypothetical protein